MRPSSVTANSKILKQSNEKKIIVNNQLSGRNEGKAKVIRWKTH